MKALSVTCPNCGARLRVDSVALEVRCEYCATSSRIQRRSAVLDRVLPVPRASAGAAPLIAVQRRSWVGRLVLMATLGGSALAGAIVMARGLRSAASPPPTPPPLVTAAPARPALPPSSWLGTDRAILVDVTGDGVLDVIGRARRSNPDQITIVAIDGATGARRWESPSLGVYIDVYQHPLALAGDLLVFASARGEVRAFSSADGTPRWTSQLDERVRIFCGTDDVVIAVGADDVWRPLRRQDGAPVTVAEGGPPATGRQRSPGPVCDRLPADKLEPTPHVRGRDPAKNHAIDLDRVWTGPSGRVLSGTRQRGTRVPILVAIDVANRERWRLELPLEPLAAAAEASRQVVVGSETVCAAYARTGDVHAAVTCVAARDGARTWHEILDHRGAPTLLIAGDALLLSTGGALEARDLGTGAVRWRFRN